MKRVLSFLLTLVLVGGMLSAALPTLAEESTGPKAPTSLVYRLDQVGGGMADGVVSVTLPKGHKADAVYLYWADDEGKLEGFSSLTPIKVSGNVVNHRMVAGSFIPFGATRLLAYTYSAGLGFSSECASFRLPQGAAVSEEALGELFMEFQSVSDPHVTAEDTGREHTRDNFRIMLEDVVKVSPGTIGVFCNGDNVNSATDADYEAFTKIYDAVKDVPSLYVGFGNHELFRFGTPVPTGQFSNMKNAYVKFMDRFTPEDATFSAGDRFSSLSFTFDRNGYKFIFLGTDVCDQNNQSLNANTLAWLEAELQESAEAAPNVPIFIITHQPMHDTTAGTFSGSSKYKKGADYGAVTDDTDPHLRKILSKFPQVILFAGHTHFDMNSTGIYYVQDNSLPHLFGTSSVSLAASTYNTLIGESGKTGEGYYVYVYGDKVLVRGRNFINGEWIASAQFMVDLSDEGLATPAAKHVKAPMYGSIPTLSVEGNQIHGTIECHLPVNSNANMIAMFFSSADEGIISDQPIATHNVNYKSSGTYDVDVLATIPENADYIAIYSYSEELGWSVDCDVINVSTNTKGGGAPATGTFSMNKYSFTEGEPIYVTAHQDQGSSWIGIRNVASSDYRTWNYWNVKDVGIGTAVDITKDHAAFGRDYVALTPGVYEIGWINGSGFLASKTPENTTTFVIHEASSNVSPSGAIKTDKTLYRLGEPIYVTATKGTDTDWVAMQLKSLTTGSRLWYYLKVSGVNQAFDITTQSNYKGTSGADYKFARLEAGEYEIGWIPADKTTFQSGKTAENLVTITILNVPAPKQLGAPQLTVSSNTDLMALTAKIAEAEKLRETHYTAESWQAFVPVLDAARKLLEGAEPTQEAADQATAALTAAIAALVRYTGEVTSETQPQEPTEKKGCGSSIGALPMVLMAALAPIVIKKKRKNQ